jgi:hypothetical protein
VVGSAGEETKLARKEEDDKHDIVCWRNFVVLGLGQNPHVDICDRPYQYRADQVSIYVASLVVKVRQAEEDVLIFRLFWTISGTNEFVVSRPFLNLLPSQEVGPLRGTNRVPLHGARIGGWRALFLKDRFGH